MAETVMLNTNIFGRPFDDISQERIHKETADCFNIILLSVLDFIKVKSSDVLFAELTLTRDKTKRELMISLANSICKENIKLEDKIIELADGIYSYIRDYMDCLHIASAAVGKCLYFITCDDELIYNKEKIQTYLAKRGYNIYIKHPSQFLKEMEGIL